MPQNQLQSILRPGGTRGGGASDGGCPFRFHGVRTRGADFHPASPSFEGRFGRMFRTLPAARFEDGDLKKLAKAMIADREPVQTPETDVDAEENQGISAGYTYLGQFIDHDLTFDPASSLQKQNDPEALIDFRTPRFDLDNVYGRGPDDQPYLYRGDGIRLLLGRQLTGNPHDAHAHDLPRNNPGPGGDPARALIGDPRNDENTIVSQLQVTMLRFHNRMADVLIAAAGAGGTPAPTFEDVQRQVRWHYQWMVLHDFLPTMVSQATVDAVLPHLSKGTSVLADPPKLQFYRFGKEPFIPIEFSAAAYRFGHSMIRPIYRLNTTLPNRQEIFSMDPFGSLTGFREFPSSWALDWGLFFDLGNGAPASGPGRVQKSYKIDTSLVNPLGNLPPSIGQLMPSLAERNLLRGKSMALPSGQAVARHLHLPVIPDEKLFVGKATVEDAPGNKPLLEISARFKHNAPLWYYVLAEAQQGFDGKDETPIHLGPVGGRIVTEVFAGLMLGDHHSYLVQDPTWRPRAEFSSTGDRFGMAELIKQALQAV